MSNHEERIARLRQTIAESERRIAELELSRNAVLSGDDDVAIDRIDSEIATLNKRIQLSIERIAATERAVAEAEEQERREQLSRLSERATKASRLGESLIAEYGKEATKLAGIFAKLSAIEQFIREANRLLTAAGLGAVSSPNAIRCKPMQIVERVERRVVGIGEEAHPLHAVANFDIDGRAYNRTSGETIERFGEVDLTVRQVIPTISQAPLHEEVHLPSADLEGAPIWPPPNMADSNDLLRELGLTDESSSPFQRLFARV